MVVSSGLGLPAVKNWLDHSVSSAVAVLAAQVGQGPTCDLFPMFFSTSVPRC